MIPSRLRPSSIVGVSFLGYLASAGLTLHVFGVFVQPVADSLGAKMAVMGLAPLLWQCVNGLAAPALGRLLGHITIRSLMVTGAALLSAGLVALSQVETLVQAGLVFGVVSIGSVMIGSIPSATLVTNWFAERRGRALGIASSGSMAAGVLLPPLSALLIGEYGWRQAFLVLGIGVATVAIPLFFAFTIDRPEDVGEPYDRADTTSEPSADESEPPVPIGSILRDRNFWLIAVSFGLIFAAGIALLLFLIPFSIQVGLSLQAGALLLSARSGAGFVGRVLLSALSDRIGPRAVMSIITVSEFVLWNVMVEMRNVVAFSAVCIAVGFMAGASFPLQSAMASSVFGRRAFPTALGLLMAAMLPFQVFVAPLTGYVYDVTGDYAVTFRGFTVVFVIAFILIGFVRIPPKGEEPS